MTPMRVFFAVVCGMVVLVPRPAYAQTDVKRLFDEPAPASRVISPSRVFPTNWESEGVAADGAAVADVNAASGGPNAASVMTNPGGGASTTGAWWIIAPYVWVPGMYGEVTTFGQTNPINIDPSDVLSELDNANGGLQLHLESGLGRIGLILDANIIRISQDRGVAAGSFEFDLQQTLIELLGSYRILDVPSDGMKSQVYAVDLVAGARYYNFFNGITFTPFDTALPTIPLGQSGTWVDLVIGARGRAPIVTGLDAFFRTDFGGFGMGTSSTLAWNLIAGVDWHATEHCSFIAGYRVFDINETQGAGTAKFAFDARLQGPFVALSLHY